MIKSSQFTLGWVGSACSQSSIDHSRIIQPSQKYRFPKTGNGQEPEWDRRRPPAITNIMRTTVNHSYRR